MDANFNACLDVILESEGGYVVDQGGPTNLGVTRTTLSHYLNHPATIEEVKALTSISVAPIYRALYWNVARCGLCPTGLDLMVFDEAVNEGPGHAIQHLQEALLLPPNGKIDPAMARELAALDTPEKVKATIMRLHADNAAYYTSLERAFPQDEKGWQARNDRTFTAAMRLVSGQATGAKVPPPIQEPPAPSPAVAPAAAAILPAAAVSPPSLVHIMAHAVAQVPRAPAAVGGGAVAVVGAGAAAVGASHMSLIDLRPLVDQVIVPFAGTLLLGVAGPLASWALYKVGEFAHVQVSASLANRVEAAMQNAVTLVLGRAQAAADAHATITVDNPMIANAVDYVAAKVPDEMKKLGITPESLAERLEARILARVPSAPPAQLPPAPAPVA